jgi:ketosteroid isomerase-like protein
VEAYQQRAIDESYKLVQLAAAGEDFEWPPLIDDDFEWVDAPDFPGGRTYRGPDELTRFFRSWARYWDEFEVIPEEFIELDEERILIPVTLRFKGGAGGPSGEQRYAHIWEFRNGKAIRLRIFSSVEQAREAAGRTAASPP